MLRKKELEELAMLQKKYCDNDEVYRLIDLSIIMYKANKTVTSDTLSELRFDLVNAKKIIEKEGTNGR